MSFPLETAFFSAAAPLYWLGALTAAWLSLRAGSLLATGFRVWVLGNGQQVGPQLGKWAGESQECLTSRSVRAALRVSHRSNLLAMLCCLSSKFAALSVLKKRSARI
ncbi:UNVERIFIED_CONTAM: hypothetical protein FKN15_001679 [Acipenser sinensis]